VSGRLGLGLAVVVLATRAAAHWIAPETIVAELNGPRGRVLGVEGAVRDDKAPRLLVIRVGEAWYRLPAEARRERAAAWLDLWRRSVDQGIVAVLDAPTDTPVVRFGPGGRAVEATGPPRTQKPSP
jgi:hypothetical protein